MFCTHCGKSINQDVKFCNHCGKSIHENSSSPLHTNKGKSSQSDIFASIIIALITLVGGIWRLIIGIFIIIGIWLFITNLGHIDPSTASISSIQSMTCKNFLTLSDSDRAEVGNRLYTAKYNEVNSMAGVNAMMELEYACNSQPNTTLGQISY